MWRPRVVALVLAVGCGRIQFGARTDGSIDAMADGEIDAPYATGPFATPVRVSELATNGVLDDDPNPTGDLLEIFFASNRTGGMGMCDIWTATRVTTTDPWGPQTSVSAFGSSACDSGPRVTRDGLTMYFASTRLAGAIYISTRPAIGQPWSPPVEVPELNSPAADGSPSISADSLIGIMFSTRLGGDDLFETRRAAPTDPWGTPTPITELNTNGRDRSPNLSPDGLTLFYISDRSGSLSSADVWMATRPSRDQPFGAPVRLAEVSTTTTEDDPWVSPDGHTMYLTAIGPGGDSDIFTATR